MKLEQLFEARYGINKNIMRGTWQLRLPADISQLVGDAPTVILMNARPLINPHQGDGKKKTIYAVIEGDLIKADNHTSEDDNNPVELSPGSFQPTGEGRPIGWDKGQANPFIYADTKEQYQGSKYVVFNGNTVTAYD